MIGLTKFQEHRHSPSTPYQGGYVPFSNRFSSYLRDLENDPVAGVKCIFISGSAGSGKTITLENEFIPFLQTNAELLIRFSFIPDQSVHNHFFISNITAKIIARLKEIKTTRHIPFPEQKNYLENVARTNNTNTIFQKSAVHDFIKLITDLSQNISLSIVFEDIHLSGRNFKLFLDAVSKVKSHKNIFLVFTTRFSKASHSVHTSCYQKWFFLKNLSENKGRKFISLVKKQFPFSDISNDYILNISEGNPFYIKEICALDEIRKKTKRPADASKVYTDIEEIRQSVTTLRISYLEEPHQKTLSILSLLGFSYTAKDLLKILNLLKLRSTLNDLEYLEKSKFVILKDGVVSFRHHLLYENIKHSISDTQKKSLHREIFFYELKKKKNRNYESLVYHSLEGGVFSYACYFSLKFATMLHNKGQNELSSKYFDIYTHNLASCSAPAKVKDRLLNAFPAMHANLLILGDKQRAESISKAIANIFEDLPLEKKFKANTILLTSYWAHGNTLKAYQLAKRNQDIANITKNKEFLVSSHARLGSIEQELGNFSEALRVLDIAYSHIDKKNLQIKFGLLPYAYAVITTIKTLCLGELGNQYETKKNIKKVLNFYVSISDNFTKLFIAVNTAYSLILLGEFRTALKYLNDAYALTKNNPSNLLIPACLSLMAQCHLYLGNYKKGIECMDLSRLSRGNTFEGTKKGMIEVSYLESLLITFDTKTFALQIDEKINGSMSDGQLPYAAWMYFLKAVYFAFYKKSVKGYVGSLAKANVIAQTLNMQPLIENLNSLSYLESSGLANTSNIPFVECNSFDKAAFFFNHTQKIQPVNFHKEN